MSFSDQDVELDFLADWVAFVRAQLQARGYVPPTEDEQACFAFFNALKRSVHARPRVVHVSPSLVCPPELLNGYEIIKRKTEVGEDLTPYLSRRLSNVDYDDPLLNDWGIHHLHLGEKIQPDGFAERTGPLLFSRFTDDHAYFIAIPNHGAWADVSIMTEFVNGWPDVAERFRLQGVVGLERVPTSADVATLRNKHGNVLLEIDGKVFAPMGGGVTGSGLAVDVVMRSDYVRKQLDIFETTVRTQKAAMFSRAAANGVSPSRPVRLRFKFDAQSGYALTDDNSFGAKLGKFII